LNNDQADSKKSYTTTNIETELLEDDLKVHYNVVSIGDLAADVALKIPHFPITAEEIQIIHDVNLEAGGAGNFLITASRLGLHAIALGAVGAADFFGPALLKILMMENVDTHHVIRQSEGNTTTVFVIIDEKGQHTFLGQYGNGQEIQYSREWDEVIHQADWVQTWGYGLKEKATSRAMLTAMKTAKEQNIPVCFDVGPHLSDLTQQQWQELISAATVVMLTESEIPDFMKHYNNWRDAENFLSLGAHWVCVKRGSDGCILISNQGSEEIAGFPATFRNSTGAGDAFAAGFAYAILHGAEPQQAASFANLVGAVKIQKVGSGRNMPTKEEIFEFMEKNNLHFSFISTT